MQPAPLSIILTLILTSLPACGQGQDPQPSVPVAPKQVGTVRILEPGQNVSDPISETPQSPPTTPQPAPAVSPSKSASAPRSPADLAARSLGHRAEIVRLNQRIIPVVVLVENEASFADAIAGWTPQARFPVLFDDGTTEAAEHIARFVRAFEPTSVLRWDSENSWPADRADRRQRILEARSKSLGVTPKPGQPHNDALLNWLSSIGYDTPGVVVTDTMDSAWPAALALASARFQPIIFYKIGPKETAGGGMSSARVDFLDNHIKSALELLSVQWQGLGTGIDAVTLVGRFPGQIRAGEKDYRALTDRIGKTTGEVTPAGTLTKNSPRWAWAGQIFGSEPAAAYTAMCSIFLETNSLWGFNAYNKGFTTGYEIEKAADLLEKNMGFETTLFKQPNNTLEIWRAATSNAGINAGLVMVNTHGNAPEFNFPDKSRGYAGDTPLLARPAIVNFIHSFSMQRQDQPNTVGGRWLAHGAYAYIGSMNEPYLDAFVPPRTLAARLAEGWAFAAAARTDHRGWWRITVFGDPLMTLGPAGTRTDDPLPLTNTIALTDSMRAALTNRDYAATIRTLVLLGRDHDAARLLIGLLNDKQDDLTPQTAAIGLAPLFRDKEFARVLDLWAFTSLDALGNTTLSDTLWAAARMQLQTGDRAKAIRLLKANLRPDQEASDAVEVAQWIAKGSGKAAIEFLRPIERRLRSNRRSKNILNRAIRSHGG